MNTAFKSIFMTLMLTLAVTTVFSEKVIKLTNSAGNLILTGDILSDGRTELGTIFNRRVRWEIQQGTGITSFEIVPKNLTQDYPFNGSLGGPHSDRLDLQVIFLLRWLNNTDWNYSIKWTDTTGSTYIYDPKIAIKPSTSVYLYVILTTGIVVASLVTARSSKKRKKKVS